MLGNQVGRSSLVAVLLAQVPLFGISPVATADDTPPHGVVYVQSNVASAPGNQILGYRRDASGNLTPLPGSPYSAGGAGISPSFMLGPYDSDQEVIANPSWTRLYATNGGSNSIAVFRFKGDGSLVPVAGSPFPSGGSDPVSLAISGDNLVVVNQDNNPGHAGASPPSYTSLKIDALGRPRKPVTSNFVVDLGSNPSQGHVPASHPHLLFGCDFLGGTAVSSPPFRFRLSRPRSLPRPVRLRCRSGSGPTRNGQSFTSASSPSTGWAFTSSTSQANSASSGPSPTRVRDSAGSA